MCAACHLPVTNKMSLCQFASAEKGSKTDDMCRAKDVLHTSVAGRAAGILQWFCLSKYSTLVPVQVVLAELNERPGMHGTCVGVRMVLGQCSQVFLRAWVGARRSLSLRCNKKVEEMIS